MTIKDSTKTLANIPKAPRFSESETEALFQKIASIAAGIEALHHQATSGENSFMRARHLDTILVLSQVAGFIADHAGGDSSYYGDIFEWLEIPAGVQS